MKRESLRLPRRRVLEATFKFDPLAAIWFTVYVAFGAYLVHAGSMSLGVLAFVLLSRIEITSR